MKSIVKLYTAEMRKKYGEVYAAWKPGTHYELGDYGTLDGSTFTYAGNVRQFGFDFEVILDPSPTNENYKSTGVSATKITANGETVASDSVNVAAGFNIEFSNENSVLYEALNVYTNRIADIAKLGTQILNLYESGLPGANGVKWQKDYVVITELDIADSATIIISNSKNAKIELQASANIGAANLNIADPKLGWDSKFEKGLESKTIANAGATPLFKLRGIRNKTFEVRRLSKEEIEFAEIVDLSD